MFLNPDTCWVDAWCFEEISNQVDNGGARDERIKKRALAYYQGPFDFEDSFNLIIREYSEKLNHKWKNLTKEI